MSDSKNPAERTTGNGCTPIPSGPPPDLDQTIRVLRGFDAGAPRAPLIAMEDLLRRTPAGDEGRRRIERELVRLLDSGVSTACKQAVCQWLGRIGTDASLEAAGRMLAGPDPHLSEAACSALVGRSSPAVDRVALAALRTAQGRSLAAVVSLAGERRLQAAAPLLKQLSGGSEASLRAAAIWALGRIGGPSATAALEELYAAPGPTRTMAAHALLEAAQLAEKDGGGTGARRIRQRLSETADAPRAVRRGARLSLGLSP